MGNEEIRSQGSLKYFSDVSNISSSQSNSGNAQDLSEKVALRISLSNVIKNAGYSIQLFNGVGQMSTPLSQSQNLEKDKLGNAVLKTAMDKSAEELRKERLREAFAKRNREIAFRVTEG